MVLGSTVSLQFGAAFATQLFAVAGSWGTTAVRLLLAAAVLFLLLRPSVRGWTARTWREVAMYGGALAGMNGFFYASIERIPLSTAVAIELLGPLVLAAVLSPRRRDLIWIGIALAGMGALGMDGLVGGKPLDALGVLYSVIAAAFWAGYILTGARVGAQVPGSGALPFGIAIAAVLVLPFGAGGASTVLANPALLLIGVATALLASVIPYSLELAALRRLPKPVFGVLLSLEPVVAAIAGILLMGQHVNVLGWVMIAAVMVASIGMTLSGVQPSARAVRRSASSASMQEAMIGSKAPSIT